MTTKIEILLVAKQSICNLNDSKVTIFPDSCSLHPPWATLDVATYSKLSGGKLAEFGLVISYLHTEGG